MINCRVEVDTMPQQQDAEIVDIRQSGLGADYLKTLAKVQELKSVRDKAELEIKGPDKKSGLQGKLLEMQAKTGYKTVLTPDWRVTITSSVNVSISKEKLLELGVPVKTIEKATKRTPYETLTVTAIKD